MIWGVVVTEKSAGASFAASFVVSIGVVGASVGTAFDRSERLAEVVFFRRFFWASGVFLSEGAIACEAQ